VDLADIGEFGLIGRLIERSAALAPPGREVLVPAGDDAAVLGLAPGQRLVATTDILVENVHFSREWCGFEDIGWKAAAANISDIAAMGALPRWLLVALGVPRECDLESLTALQEGLARCAADYGVTIVGGDITGSPCGLLVSVCALGTLERAPLLRSGARPGDALMVTGALGGSAAGLAIARAGGALTPEEQALVERHRRPHPRVKEGLALGDSGLVGALIDVSDGVAGDAARLSEASGLRVVIEAESLPLAPGIVEVAARVGANHLDWALSGGEDFELLLTAPSESLPALRALLAPLGCPLTPIGRCEAGAGVEIVGHPPARGYDHFARSGLGYA